MAGLRGFCVKDGRIFYDNNYTDFEKRLALLVEQNRDAFTDSDSDTGSSDDAGENMIQMQPNDKISPDCNEEVEKNSSLSVCSLFSLESPMQPEPIEFPIHHSVESEIPKILSEKQEAANNQPQGSPDSGCVSDIDPLPSPPPVIQIDDDDAVMPVLENEANNEFVDKWQMPILERQVEVVYISDRSSSEVEEDSVDHPHEVLEETGTTEDPYMEWEESENEKDEDEEKTEELHNSGLHGSMTFFREVDPNKQLLWCKICDNFYLGIDELRLHVSETHPRVNVRMINEFNYATYDLEIARVPGHEFDH